jgi:hypothetical protein
MIKGSLTAKPQVFAAAVGWAAKFVTAKPVVPVHGGILLDVTDGTLTVVSYSENVSTRAVLPVDGDAAGRAVVSGRLLASLVGTLADKPVALEGADDHLKLTAGTFRATLPTMAEDEYPDPPAVPAPIGAVSGDAFAAMVQRVAVAASTDLSNRVALAGLHLTFADGWVTALATDSYRAATGYVPSAACRRDDRRGAGAGRDHDRRRAGVHRAGRHHHRAGRQQPVADLAHPLADRAAARRAVRGRGAVPQPRRRTPRSTRSSRWPT